MSIEELKAKVTKKIQYLHKCKNYITSSKAAKSADKVTDVFLSILHEPDKQSVLAKHVAQLNLGSLFKTIWQTLSGFITKKNTQGYHSLWNILGMYANITDISPEVSKELAENGCITSMMQAMDMYRDKYDGELVPLQAVSLTLLNAIQNCPENVSVYRESNAIPICKRYLDCKDMVMKVQSLSTLAYIVDEQESGILQTTNDGVAFLLSLIKDAISSKDHRVQKLADTQSSALELLRALNKLAVNDANKTEIAKLGGIPVFTQMLRNDFSEDEQCAAVKALWNLAFIDEIRLSEEMQSSVKALEKLAISDFHHLREICAHALWQINGQHLSASGHKEKAPPTYEEAITQPVPSASSGKAQVMISYQWDNQETTKRLRDNLVSAGYQVWMDITHMRGSLLDAMAKAVETSSLVLVCMSEKYKNSENCRAEAQYAFTLKKPIVPLLLEPKYRPDGWLGILGRTTLYHDITSPSHLDSKMEAILADIKFALGDVIDGPIQPTGKEVQSTVRKSSQKESSGRSKKPVRQWTTDDVQDWLKENDLTMLSEAFQRFKGRHLEELYFRCSADKKAFYKELKTDYNMNGKTCTEFVVALEEACED